MLFVDECCPRVGGPLQSLDISCSIIHPICIYHTILYIHSTHLKSIHHTNQDFILSTIYYLPSTRADRRAKNDSILFTKKKIDIPRCVSIVSYWPQWKKQGYDDGEHV